MVPVPAVEDARARSATVWVAVLVKIDKLVESAEIDGSGSKSVTSSQINLLKENTLEESSLIKFISRAYIRNMELPWLRRVKIHEAIKRKEDRNEEQPV